MFFVNTIAFNIFAFILLDITALKVLVLLLDIMGVTITVLIAMRGKLELRPRSLSKALSLVVLVIYTCLLYAGIYTQFLCTDALEVNAKLQNSGVVNDVPEELLPTIPRVLGESILLSYETVMEAAELAMQLKEADSEDEVAKVKDDITALSSTKDVIVEDFNVTSTQFIRYIELLMVLDILYRVLDSEMLHKISRKRKEVVNGVH